MNQHKNGWTRQDEDLVLLWVNNNVSTSGQVKWKGLYHSSINGHSYASCQTHWNRGIKPKCTFNGVKWTRKQSNLFDGTTPMRKVDSAKKPPQNAPEGTLSQKQVKTSNLKFKKSFLWGALVIEQYN